MVRSALAEHWLLDPSIVFLNHGSFGACPSAVLDLQTALRERMEREPVTFLVSELERLLDQARAALAQFLGADAPDLAFVPNATTGFNAVLRALEFAPGDELLATTHGYNAARNALEYVASRSGARVVYAEVPFPVRSASEVAEAILSRVSTRTRLALIDHITSPTALIFPISDLVDALESRGVQTLVDGAHAPGMVPLDLRSLGASYYTGNCHKWLSAPKGAAFLFVRRDRQALVRPTIISHGANSPRTDRSRYLLEFDWMGTDDPTAYLCIPAAIDFLAGLVPGGWPAVMRHNHELALNARDLLCRRLGLSKPVPDDMIGSMATVALPDGPGGQVLSPLDSDPLRDVLFERFRIEVPVWPWPQPPRRALRVSAHLYNDVSEYENLASALTQVL
jgi:isopenicillin-N epimerase